MQNRFLKPRKCKFNIKRKQKHLQEVATLTIPTLKSYQHQPAPSTRRKRLWNCRRISAAILCEDRNVKLLFIPSLFWFIGSASFSAWLSTLTFIFWFFSIIFLFWSFMQWTEEWFTLKIEIKNISHLQKFIMNRLESIPTNNWKIHKRTFSHFTRISFLALCALLSAHFF